jgi:hypothetical protein
MMDSRRWPRPTPGSTWTPPSSGPRWIWLAFMRSSSARSISRFPFRSKIPTIPHMISLFSLVSLRRKHAYCKPPPPATAWPRPGTLPPPPTAVGTPLQEGEDSAPAPRGGVAAHQPGRCERRVRPPARRHPPTARPHHPGHRVHPGQEEVYCSPPLTRRCGAAAGGVGATPTTGPVANHNAETCRAHARVIRAPGRSASSSVFHTRSASSCS